jgi:hypothetical protein
VQLIFWFAEELPKDKLLYICHSWAIHGRAKSNQNELSAFQKKFSNAIHEFHHVVSEPDISARKENK